MLVSQRHFAPLLFLNAFFTAFFERPPPLALEFLRCLGLLSLGFLIDA